jgi:hypothetical protein
MPAIMPTVHTAHNVPFPTAIQATIQTTFNFAYIGPYNTTDITAIKTTHVAAFSPTNYQPLSPADMLSIIPAVDASV